jgi:RNA 3'-terminal phosphate cyclase (ATP)
MTTIRDILNRARWRDAGLHALSVHVVHRGAKNDQRAIPGSRIKSVRAGGVDLAAETDGADEGFVPYHRFLAIVASDGAVLWSKAASTHAEAALSEDALPRPPASSPALPTTPSEGDEVHADFDVVLRPASAGAPLVLDGSAGEGGGQILRTALALAMATGTPFVLDNIRGGRKKPGLMRQHLTCVKAAALVSNAEVEGATLGSSRIVFRPGAIAAGDLAVDIGSAGSISLVLQTVALAFALAPGPSRLVVRGGTHALWAPPFPFLAEAWLPLVRRAGAKLDLELRGCGFHPAGGGEVVMTASPSGGLAPLHLGPSSVLSTLELRAIVSGISEGIARRELVAASDVLTGERVTLASETVRSVGPGNAMWLVARDDASDVANVFSGIGEVGTPAEDVGRDVAKAFLAWRASGTSVEAHLADQLMLPIALAGAGSFTTNELTLHARTNIEVTRVFTGRRIRAWNLRDGRFRVELSADGAAPTPA